MADQVKIRHADAGVQVMARETWEAVYAGHEADHGWELVETDVPSPHDPAPAPAETTTRRRRAAGGDA